MLNVAADYASRWHLRFNPKKWGELIVVKKRREGR